MKRSEPVTVCDPDAHQWRSWDFKHLEHRPNGVANETWRFCGQCPAIWHQIEVSHWDQPMADGSSKITVEPGQGLILPADVAAAREEQ